MLYQLLDHTMRPEAHASTADSRYSGCGAAPAELPAPPNKMPFTITRLDVQPSISSKHTHAFWIISIRN